MAKRKSVIDEIQGIVKEKADKIAEERTIFELINGVNIKLPLKPVDRYIVNYSTPKDDQIFVRTKQPTNFHKLSINEQEAFLTVEKRRFKYGEWYFINGEPKWFPGSYYFFLNYIVLNNGIPEHREDQRLYSVFKWEAKNDPKCYGTILLKARRFGATAIELADQLLDGMLNERKHLGLISKSGPSAKETFSKLARMFMRLPDYIRPAVDGKPLQSNKLHFIKPTKRTSVNNSEIEMAMGLDTIIDWANTTNNAYDGEAMFRIRVSEAGKLEKVDISEWWDIAKATLHDPDDATIVDGKCFMESTINKDNTGGEGFKKVYWGDDGNESNYETRNENGNTRSGLWKYFIPAFCGLPGFIDKFGYSIIDDPLPTQRIYKKNGERILIGAKTHLERRRTNIRNPEKLAEEKRLFPFNEEEALKSYGKLCYFNLDNIEAQLKHLALTANKGVTYGNYRWHNNERDSYVEFIPCHPDEARWKKCLFPIEAKRNYRKWGRLFPHDDEDRVAGCDPIDQDLIDDGQQKRKSKGASHIFYLEDPTDPENSDRFTDEYIYRPPIVNDFYEDMIMQCVFNSCKLFVEKDRGGGLLSYFKERGYYHYIMEIPKGFFDGNMNTPIQGGINAKPAAQALVSTIETYSHRNCHKVLFADTLNDWKNFDATDTRKFDATMSSGYTLLAAKRSEYKIKKKNQTKNKVNSYSRIYEVE